MPLTKYRVFTAEDESSSEDLYIRAVCFSPNGEYLAAGAEDKTIKVLVIIIF